MNPNWQQLKYELLDRYYFTEETILNIHKFSGKWLVINLNVTFKYAHGHIVGFISRGAFIWDDREITAISEFLCGDAGNSPYGRRSRSRSRSRCMWCSFHVVTQSWLTFIRSLQETKKAVWQLFINFLFCNNMQHKLRLMTSIICWNVLSYAKYGKLPSIHE